MTVHYRCIPAVTQNSRGALPRNSIPRSPPIHPACQNPGLRLPAAQTLAMNIASQSGRDQGKKKPSWGKGKKNPPAGVFFILTWLGFFFFQELKHLWNTIHLKPTYNPLQKHNHQPHTDRHHLHAPTTLITPHAHPIHSAPCLPAPSVGHAPQERCSREPQNSPCLPKPRSETARGPNIGDEHRLAERPGPGEKKTQLGERKKNPPAGVFFILTWLVFFFFPGTPTSLENNTSQAHIQPTTETQSSTTH